jgi:hypothetical protein
MTCSPHNKSENYQETKVGGRIRINCKVCGRFIGYKRPASEKLTKKDKQNDDN